MKDILAVDRTKLANQLILVVLLFVFFTACKEEAPKASWGSVQHAGALKNMMHKGDLSTNISLDELKDKKHLYALGAMTNLKGEIQIFDGIAYNSVVDMDTLRIDNSFEKDAALLVYAQVEAWDSVPISATIVARQDLESFIVEQAKEKGININAPFPFLLEGTFKSIEWHVINWKDGDTEHSHEKHIKSGLYGTLHDIPAQMLGFYSKKHTGIFTHHTADTHIHFKLNNEKISGHADNVEVSNSVVLKLPKTTN